MRPDASGPIYVIETYDDIFLGHVRFDRGQVVIYSGFVGRPVTLDGAELLTMTPADEHPDVEQAVS